MILYLVMFLKTETKETNMNLVTKGINTENLPDRNGYFGEFGGSYLPEALEKVMQDVEKAYEEISKDPQFIKELKELNKTQA